MLWIVIIVLVLALAFARACALSTKRKGNVVKKIYSNYFRNCRKMNIPHLMMWFSKPLMEQRKSAMVYRQTRHANQSGTTAFTTISNKSELKKYKVSLNSKFKL